MGPYAVHSSVLDWPNMMLETRVNGQVRQSANTSQLIFDIPTLIATCSMGITLQPGDVIATGTPAGVCLSLGEPPPACAPLNEKGIVGSNATTKGMRLAGATGPVGS
ncbi:hypothetical protein I308_101684 [Cryptococcus tetragattii IND107]|uniref:Fumarylacetoacetase-like C-terminal domain-containing protein n=1 Tax=Cryptococcus tetragattii IND107 TaxID=1296105 RepID=A0ABR3BV73_9TREE